MSASTPHADVEQGRGIAAAWLRKNPTKAPTEEEVEMAAAYLVSRSARFWVPAKSVWSVQQHGADAQQPTSCSGVPPFVMTVHCVIGVSTSLLL